MAQQPEADLPLSPYRVLDLSDEKGFLCGRILGDLGADVVKIEPPGGDPSRNHGPFLHGEADPHKSLYWLAYNFNKRGVTLNLQTADGRAIFKRLVERSDFLIETFQPGHMERLGLGYQALRQINRRLIVVSITPFGQTGPHSRYKADDLVAMAAGGIMAITGDDDRPPLRVGIPQSYALAGSQAAAGVMLAHYLRLSTGEGQHIDVSMQEAVACALVESNQFWFVEKEPGTRGVQRQYGGRMVKGIYPAKDGYITFQIFWGPASGRRMTTLGQWMAEEGYECDFTKVDFSKVTGFAITQEQLEHYEDEVAEFTRRFTKEEIYKQALKRRLFLFPVSSPKDLLADPQLQARGFWQPVEHPELGEAITYPGLWCAMSETPMRIRRRAPLIGEHNLEVYEQGLGYTREELVTLKEAGVI